ncbi:MAG: hypothetical protein MI974_10585 [Chitinophagales bacterium]|nr:hypothetical protein [Chitinophagales bacterium]
MKFQLTPVLEQMASLYKLPRDRTRFDTYLSMLQGDGKDMILPIAGYNPMGKEDVLDKINELIALGAEELVQDEIARINEKKYDSKGQTIGVAINLVDNLGGAWSNLYTTDYTSKFRITTLIKRNFCTPYFWISEPITEALIIQRTREYIFRTIFCITQRKPQSLKDCFDQEVFVQQNVKPEEYNGKQDFGEIESFYLNHQASEDYNLIFNFFYGDNASASLGYTAYGRKNLEGFDYARYFATSK